MSEPAGCAVCDEYGPDATRLAADLRASHRALHDLGRTVAEELLLPLVAWLARRLPAA